MAPKWTPTRDQNLLLLIIQDLKPDYAQLAGKWKKVFREYIVTLTFTTACSHITSQRMRTSCPPPKP